MPTYSYNHLPMLPYYVLRPFSIHDLNHITFQAHGHNTIHATLVCPYYINTGMFDGVTPRLMPMLEPDYVAETMLDSIRKNEVNCIMPGSVRYLLPLKWFVLLCYELLPAALFK